MQDCIFCKIIAGEIPSKKVFEDELVLAFHDINPMAPVHVIIVPKAEGDNHINSAHGVSANNSKYIARIFEVIPQIAKSLGLSDNNGYRVVTNIGKDGGQTVDHIHFHLIGGERLPISSFA